MTEAEGLKAGAAEVDITPPMGTQIAGDIGRHRPAELVVDPIHARALVLESGECRLCIVSCDVAIVTREYVAEIRRGLQARFGLPAEAVMVHAVQNHAAPGIGDYMLSRQCRLAPPELPWLRGNDERYDRIFVERISDAVGRAQAALEPVWFGAASGIEARIAFNRRFVMRDGTVRTHPVKGDPNILYCEGPIDPELGVASFTTDSLRIVSLLLHYTCHPVHGYPQRYVSAGWPGAWARGMKEACGGAPLVLNGCCGNIHHANPLDPSYVDDFQRHGRCLTETALQVLRAVRPEKAMALASRVGRVRIPLRRIEPAALEQARRLLAEHPQPVWRDEARTAIEWDWVYALSLLDLHERQQREPEHDCEVQVFRIGDIAIVALPGEPFVEGQLRIKLESPARRTFVAHNSNDALGYVPTAEAFKRGGYETRTSTWSRLAPEALEMLCDEAIRTLQQVF